MITPDDWEDADLLDKEFGLIVKKWVKKSVRKDIKHSLITWALMRNALLACLEAIDEEDLLSGIHTIIDVNKGRIT